MSSRRTLSVTHVPLAAALLALIAVVTPACDHGLEPPGLEPLGTIRGTIRYEGTWPSQGAVHDLRFVAMRFVPRDTADFLQLNRMAISDRLAFGVATDTFRIPDVESGVFVYSGVAQQFNSDLLSWRPVGLYEANDGIFEVPPGGTVDIEVTVDFSDPPVFPPPF